MAIMKFSAYIMILLVCAAFLIMPASAGVKYTSGSPDMDVKISGTNEFEPGSDAALTVIVSNTGEVGTKIIQSDIVTRDDMPNTARLVTIDLLENGAPIKVKTDAQMLGSILSGTTVPATFSITINKDAQPGTYTLNANLKYKYLYYAEQYGTDAMTYTYKDVDELVPLKIKIKENMQLEISNLKTDSMNVGVEGYITMDVKNVGAETGHDTVIRLNRADGSAIVPTDASSYVGEFAPGDVANVKFKASVSNEGEAKTYPVLVYATYKDTNGKDKKSDTETVGVKVGGKVKFEITSEAGSFRPGQKGNLVITYKNIGDTTAYNAQARISAVKPFTSNDDTAYLGDIAPGESVTGVYKVSVASDATEKDYGVDTEIRYRDILDNSQISDSMKAQVKVKSLGNIGDIFTNPIVLTVLVFVLIIAGYLVYQRKIKNNA
jgi:hypothetical protein